MATLNTKSRAKYEEWLSEIPDSDLKGFVFSNTTPEIDFGSDDFKLVHSGISDGDPADCHMIETRVHGQTKDKQLKKLFKTTASLASNQTRLAFALVPTRLAGYCTGDHVRRALQDSPVPGMTVVNKVLIAWSPNVRWVAGMPHLKVGFPPFVLERIPFEGYNVDGTVGAKKKGVGK